MSIRKLILSKEFISNNKDRIKNIIDKSDIIITLDKFSSKFIKKQEKRSLNFSFLFHFYYKILLSINIFLKTVQ